MLVYKGVLFENRRGEEVDWTEGCSIQNRSIFFGVSLKVSLTERLGACHRNKTAQSSFY